MSNFITDYGMRAAFAAAQKPVDITNDPRAVDAALDEMLRSLPDEHPIDTGFSFTFNGRQITAADVLKMAAPQIHRIRLDAITQFERYFTGSTDPQKLIADYQSGGEQARRTLRLMGIFPLEAISVRSEIAFPQLIQLNAGLHADETTGFGSVAAMFENSVLLQLTGPYLPPKSPANIVEYLQKAIPELDRQTRQFLASNVSAKPAQRMN